jgi:hypothetical protein
MEGARSMEGTRLDTQACAGQNPKPPPPPPPPRTRPTDLHPALAFLSLDLPCAVVPYHVLGSGARVGPNCRLPPVPRSP